jgi:hypothetical protein
LAINFAPNSYADIAGKDYKELARDADFVKAVKAVVEKCLIQKNEILC